MSCGCAAPSSVKEKIAAFVALSPFDHISYWDSNDWGGIGFVSQATKGIRMRYVIHPGAKDGGCAELDHARATTPVRVTLE